MNCRGLILTENWMRKTGWKTPLVRMFWMICIVIFNATFVKAQISKENTPLSHPLQGQKQIVETSTKGPVPWEEFHSKITHIQPHSSRQGDVFSTYPSWMQLIYTDLFNWEPRVKTNDNDALRCRLSFSSTSLKERVNDVREFIVKNPNCVYFSEAHAGPTLTKLAKALSVEFNLSDTQKFRKVQFDLPGAEKKTIQIRGLLGIHDNKPRPLVILRMGVHGNVDEFLAERFIAKLAFEDFGYNFLALENLTSHGYLASENPITFGGVDEGLQTFYILQELTQKNVGLKKLISEVHLTAISLGSHGAFLTQALDEVNNHVLKSLTLFCPVVNLDKTMRHHSEANFGSAFIDIWNHRRLMAVHDRLPEIDKGWWKTYFDFKPRFTPHVLDYLEHKNTKPVVELPADMKTPPGLKDHLVNSKTFSELNNFWPYYVDQKTPVLIVTTAKDLLVSEELNANLILQGKQQGNFSKTEILSLERGTHCGLPPDFHWNFIVDMLSTQWKKTDIE